jgi:hypothetical protein
MKRILFALFAVIVATALLTVFVTCDSAFIAIGQGKKLPDISKLKKKTSSSWGEEFWGEWLRVDEPEVWYIAGDGITIDDVASSKNISMTKQSARIIEVREGGADYLLYASRIPNSTFRGTLRRLADDSSSSGLRASFGTEIGGPALALGSGLGGIKITVRNLKNAADKKEAETGADGGFEVPNATPGDEYEVAPQVEDGPTVKVTPVAEDEDIGNITVTGGVNFKAAIRAGTGTDMTTLYADGRDYNIILEIENVGKLDSAGATAVFTADSGLTLSQANAALGTIASGEKQTVALTVSASAINENEVTRKIDVAVSDNASGKTIEDFVTLHFFKGRTNFNIKSNATVQGVVMSPHGKSASFKTESVGNYAASVSLPCAEDDYLVSVSGASGAAYSIGISSMPYSGDFEGIADQYEPNNTESAAYVIDAGLAPAKITALLPSGDIDYYKIQNAAVAPELALVDVAWREVEGESNGDGIFSAGEQVSLDFKFLNNSGSEKVATLTLSVDAAYSSYITISPASVSTGSIDADGSRVSEAFTVTASIDCPVNEPKPNLFSLSIDETPWPETVPIVLAPEVDSGHFYKQNGAMLEIITAVTAPILPNALLWLKDNAEANSSYVIESGAYRKIGPQVLDMAAVNNKTGVQITLKGHEKERTVQLTSGGALFTIEAGITFVLEENITLKGLDTNQSLVVVSYGTFIMNGGEISNNAPSPSNAANSGGGVYVSNNGSFTMNGGEISNCTAFSNGGGVAIVSGIFVMNGGKILNNYTHLTGGGGGVYVGSGTFTMSGGEISGNHTGETSTSDNNLYGGGVYMANGAIFKKESAPGSSTSGIIYGYTVGDPKSNVVKNSGGAIVPSKGHAVYVSGTKKRETTVTASQSLDSTQDGAAGGWTE